MTTGMEEISQEKFQILSTLQVVKTSTRVPPTPPGERKAAVLKAFALTKCPDVERNIKVVAL